MKLAALLALLALHAGCDMMCTSDLRWGLSIRVSDADTGQPVPAMVVVRDGEYVEQLMLVGDRHVGAGERAGTYRIDIIAEGYGQRTLTDIAVDEDGCHVDTRRLDVALARP